MISVVKRAFDLTFSFLALLILALPLSVLGVLVVVSSGRPVLHWSDRMGRENKLFKMPKFRSMRLDTPVVATHLLANSNKHVTPIGSFLRKNSLDELPQVWSIFVGKMSFVGPRPALVDQRDLIELRTQECLHELLPGMTGWAQVNGRDNLSISEKVAFDSEYMRRQSLLFDLKIIWLTLFKVFQRSGIKH